MSTIRKLPRSSSAVGKTNSHGNRQSNLNAIGRPNGAISGGERLHRAPIAPAIRNAHRATNSIQPRKAGGQQQSAKAPLPMSRAAAAGSGGYKKENARNGCFRTISKSNVETRPRFANPLKAERTVQPKSAAPMAPSVYRPEPKGVMLNGRPANSRASVSHAHSIQPHGQVIFGTGQATASRGIRQPSIKTQAHGREIPKSTGQFPKVSSILQAKTTQTLKTAHGLPARGPQQPWTGQRKEPARTIRLAPAGAAPAYIGARVVQRASSGVAKSLSLIAAEIHTASGGSLSQSTTGVGKLKNGTLVVATQLSVDTVKSHAAGYGVAGGNVIATYGAGYHTEVSLYIKYGAELASVGASQGFCPHCQEFLAAKGIAMDGSNRSTKDQVWRSPEYYFGKEKDPIGASYPWVYFKDDVEGKRIEFATRADYGVWYEMRTGQKYK